MLNFEPSVSDDEVDFEDDFFSSNIYDSGGHFDDDTAACCIPSELLEQCPYPACPTGTGSENPPVQPMSLAHNSPSSPHALFSAHTAPVVKDRPSRWWEKRRTASDKTLKLVGEGSGSEPISPTEQYREYAFNQQRNGVCVHDETYDIWVKTTCHGQRNTLTYQLFADAQCHFPMSKVQHVLSDVLPYYGKCVGSKAAGGRASLTVCSNNGNVVPPVPVYTDAY